MPVPFSSDELDALGGLNVTRSHFVELDFPSGVLYLHRGVNTLTLEGKTWVGMGNPLYPGVVAGITGIRREKFGESAAATLYMSGAVSSFIRSIYDTRREIEGRRATIYRAVFDPETFQLIGPMRYLIKNGRMSSPKWKRTGPDSHIVTITVENRMASLNFSPGHRWSAAGHRALYPGDGAMDYVGMQIIETLK